MVKPTHPEEHAVVGALHREQPDPFTSVKSCAHSATESEWERVIGPPNHRATSGSAFRAA
jgi:hypothetical protein